MAELLARSQETLVRHEGSYFQRVFSHLHGLNVGRDASEVPQETWLDRDVRVFHDVVAPFLRGVRAFDWDALGGDVARGRVHDEAAVYGLPELAALAASGLNSARADATPAATPAGMPASTAEVVDFARAAELLDDPEEAWVETIDPGIQISSFIVASPTAYRVEYVVALKPWGLPAVDAAAQLYAPPPGIELRGQHAVVPLEVASVHGGRLTHSADRDDVEEAFWAQVDGEFKRGRARVIMDGVPAGQMIETAYRLRQANGVVGVSGSDVAPRWSVARSAPDGLVQATGASTIHAVRVAKPYMRFLLTEDDELCVDLSNRIESDDFYELGWDTM
ncbi:hypothetical protein DFJ74DRAFT_707783 [Hyaloraphidium curvatum]|nr:hypothetical protein DFJ74DRAFT_707783 [Hyaloraphidium curvatum]